MSSVQSILFAAPAVVMLLAVVLSLPARLSTGRLWRRYLAMSWLALACSVLAAAFARADSFAPGWLVATRPGLGCAVLVQLLGVIIAAFSARYLEGERNQRGFVISLGSVLAAVHVFLIADHWLVLIAAWSLVGLALERLQCFYPERPFARLAAHKKHISDRGADLLLVGAALLAWGETGSGSLSSLWSLLAQGPATPALQACALLVALAVIVRTALMPAHGWLLQVMEAPTPVSALLHAGVVNLGGFVLIRFAPLFNETMPARAVLFVFGLATAVLAGLVMLTRVSIKLRLAWSTVAQMGFMVLECAMGLYTMAALHLVGHSLYKAHRFLSASGAVRQSRIAAMRGTVRPSVASVTMAPAIAVAAIVGACQALGGAPWPWWWSVTLGVAYAPLMWTGRSAGWSSAAGLAMVASFAGLLLLAHRLPLGLRDAPVDAAGIVAMAGLGLLYSLTALLHVAPQRLTMFRRWCYAGFYLDDVYTGLALQVRAVPQPPRVLQQAGLSPQAAAGPTQ
jgi:NAD(P)H-quinone oxidoreductase subunit 5